DRARREARDEARHNAGKWRVLTRGAHSEFVGYDPWDVQGVTIREVQEAPAGEPGPGGGATSVELTLDTAPFYAESGGQVADTGILESMPGVTRARLRIVDVYRDGDRIVHRGEFTEGGPETLAAGPYRAIVDAAERASTQRNHTATHLLHAALRQRFGSQLKQAGSLVAPDHLRFDFTHAKALTTEELHAIETLVNEKILEDLPVETEWTSLREAQEKGAMALFGEKYGERVRQVIVEDYSRELCGGCHVRRTGEIGYMRIESEAAIAAGTRRVEALTGALAYKRAEEDRALLRELAARLGAPREQLAGRVQALQEEARRLHERQTKQSKEQLTERVLELSRKAKTKGDPPLVSASVEAASVEELRDAS